MTRFFVRHTVTTWMIFTAFVVLGIYALPRLPIEAIPEVSLPTLTIQTRWRGASPKAVQRSITLPIEEAVRRVHGIEKLSSTSRAGQSQVEISFRRNIDIEFARLEINEQLGSVRRNLPLNADQPQILPYVPEEFRTEEFFAVNLESPLEPNELRENADTWILPQILALEGVADARVNGGGQPIVRILLDRERLDHYGITADEIFGAVMGLDDLSGAGAIRKDGEERLVALRQPLDLRALERAVVSRRGGRSYTLGMLGKVTPDYEDPTVLVRANGQNVVWISVDKRSGSNSVTVSRTLREALPEIDAAVPFEVDFYVTEDQGEELEEKLVELVYRSLAILAILFVLLAATLRQVKLTAIVIGSILFAIVISLSMFYFFKLSVNFVTISGLTVCFGLILDNSILVLDSIHRRLTALARADNDDLSWKSKLRVAVRMIVSGTHEVTFPILATTFTTMVAFLSFIFLSGRLALYYVPLAISVATAMGASIFVAFGWVPVVLNQAWARSLVRKSSDGSHEVTDENEIESYVEDRAELDVEPRFIERVFAWGQKLWWIILPATTALLIWSGFTYKDKVIKGGFWRIPDREELFLYLQMPAGTDVAVASETLWKFEESLMPVPDGARMRMVTWGDGGYIRVEFEDELLKTETPMLYRSLLAEQADQTGGSSIFIRGFAEQAYVKGNFGGAMLNSTVKITGYNSRRLNDIAENAMRHIQRNRRARNTRITTGGRFEASSDETVIIVDRNRLAENGLSVAMFTGHLRRLLGVDIPWSMLIDGEQERVQLAFLDSEEIEFSDVASAVVTAPNGKKIRVGDLASIRQQPLSGPVTRENQRYTVNLNWEYVGTDRMREAFIKQVLDGLELPYGYSAEEAERIFFTEEEEEELTMTLLLALAFIFMVLAALFESVTLPIMVLLSVPLALVGVIMIFWLTDSSFDSSARIGLVLLFGIVVNNAILLISRYRTEATLILKAKLGGDPTGDAALFRGGRKQLGGTDLWVLPGNERAALLRRAVARGTRIRLRSVLLTSLTTIVGLSPLLVKFGEREGKDIWENLALSSIGGLASSTLLLLVCMPPLYYFCIRTDWVWRRFAAWVKRIFWRLFRRRAVDEGAAA